MPYGKENNVAVSIARKMFRTAVNEYYNEHGKHSSSYYERTPYRISFSYKEQYGSKVIMNGPKDYKNDFRCKSSMSFEVYFMNTSDPASMLKDLSMFWVSNRLYGKNTQNDLTAAAKTFSNWIKEHVDSEEWVQQLQSKVEKSMLLKNVKQQEKVRTDKTNLSAL